MRVKLFSHIADPDGLGSVILASLTFKNLDYTLCKNNSELNEVLKEFFEKKEYLKYEKIFITDLCPSEVFIKLLGDLGVNILVFDHHMTEKEKLSKEYPFVISMEERNSKFTCATELFYEYLIKENSQIDRPTIKTFVEYTRLHDTYDWKRTGNLEAYKLQTLFQHLGWYGYLRNFQDKCLNEKSFMYNEKEKNWILTQEQKNRESLENLLKYLRIKKEESITYGALIGNYEYRNLLADEIAKIHNEIDVFLLIAHDNNSVSFRSLKDIPVENIAKEYGGGGHLKAASCKLTPEIELKLIKRFII